MSLSEEIEEMEKKVRELELLKEGRAEALKQAYLSLYATWELILTLHPGVGKEGLLLRGMATADTPAAQVELVLAEPDEEPAATETPEPERIKLPEHAASAPPLEPAEPEPTEPEPEETPEPKKPKEPKEKEVYSEGRYRPISELHKYCDVRRRYDRSWQRTLVVYLEETRKAYTLDELSTITGMTSYIHRTKLRTTLSHRSKVTVDASKKVHRPKLSAQPNKLAFRKYACIDFDWKNYADPEK